MTGDDRRPLIVDARPVGYLTPEAFADKMHEIYDRPWRDCDIDIAHEAADDVLCALLEALGYGEGIAVYRKATR